MRVTVLWDGGCSMAKGVAAGAAVAYDEEGVELARRSKLLLATEQVRVTTPMAEYTALVVGLQVAKSLGATSVRAMGDAELIVRQVDGRYRCRKDELKPYLELVHALMGTFEHAEVLELPKGGPKMKRRWGNVEADALASQTMKEMRDL